MKNRYDTIIIGSGCGGSAAAALMSSLGHKTLLLEKNDAFGGRTMTYEKDGFKFDHGHVLMRCENGPHGQVLRLAGRKKLIPKFSHCRFWPMSSVVGDVPLDFLPNVFMAYLNPLFYVQAHGFQLTPKVCWQLFRFASVLALNKKKDWDAVNYVDLKSYLNRYCLDETFHLFFGGLASVSFGATSDRASAGELMRVVQHGLYDLIKMGYPVTGEGIAAIPNSFMAAAKMDGCEIYASTPVERIIIENGRATGVRVNGENIMADNVITSIGLKESITKLVGREHFDKQYLSKLDSLTYSYGGISLKYALKKKITRICWGGEIPGNMDEVCDDMVAGRVPYKFPLMWVMPSNIDPTLAPPGKQVISFLSGGPPAEPGTVDWTRWVEKMQLQANTIFPGLKENTLYCDVSTPDDIANFSGRMYGDAVGVSQNVDQVADRRPSPISPIKGLYFAGADVGRGNCATELASESAIAIYKHFTGKKKKR